MIWRRGPLELEVEWDHGPDLSLIFYGHRTHILSGSWSAYPVLGKIERMPRTGEPYAVTEHPPGWRPDEDPRLKILHYFEPVERQTDLCKLCNYPLPAHTLGAMADLQRKDNPL